MSTFTLSRAPARVWVTAAAALTVILLLWGFKWQYSRYNPIYYTPPTAPHVESDHQPDGVADVGPKPTASTNSPSTPNPPVVTGPQTKANDGTGIPAEDAGNATLGVRIASIKSPGIPFSDIAAPQFSAPSSSSSTSPLGRTNETA